MYYEPEKEPSGCMEFWIITRAVFGVLIWPLLALFAAVGWLVLTLYAFFTAPLLALIPLVLGIGALMLFARWERGRFRPPEA